jgi:hypothetical protein
MQQLQALEAALVVSVELVFEAFQRRILGSQTLPLALLLVSPGVFLGILRNPLWTIWDLPAAT